MSIMEQGDIISDVVLQPEVTLTTAITHPELMGKVFANESYWTWKTIAKVLDGIRLTEEREIAFFEQCSGRPYNRQAQRAVRRLILLIGRRGDKDRFQSAVAVWRAALCINWNKHISAGEGAVVILLGSDRKQANILAKYCKGLLAEPKLAAEVTRMTDELIEFRSGGSIEICTNDAGTVRNRSAVAILGTEACQWKTDDASLSSDEEVVTAAFPSMAMCPDVPGGIGVLASSVYRKKGYMWRKYKELHGNGDSPEICWFATPQMMNPLLAQSVVDEALAGDRARMSAEYLNIWREDISDFIPMELLEECTDWSIYERPPQRGIVYLAHVDMASGLGSSANHSSAALSIAHRDKEGMLIQDVIREIRPPFVPELVVKQFAELAKSYGCSAVYADQYAFNLHASLWALSRVGVQLVEAKHDTTGNYMRLLPPLLAKRVRFLDYKTQRMQFASLERCIKSGNEVIGKPGNVSARDDCSTAASGALVAAGDVTAYLGGVAGAGGYNFWGFFGEAGPPGSKTREEKRDEASYRYWHPWEFKHR